MQDTKGGMRLQWISPTAFLVVLSGILMNTSIAEIAGIAIPVFYAVLPLLIFRLLVTDVRFPRREIEVPFKVTVFSCSVAAILSIVTLGHIVLTSNSALSEIKQLGARFALLLFFLLSYLAFHRKSVRYRAVLYTAGLLKVLLLYGIYQFAALFYDFPRFLDFLRNSPSFGLRDLESTEPGGWLETLRATSVWTEPSYSALPAALLLYLLYFGPASRLERATWTFVTLLYALLTFSRVVWLTVLLLVLFLWFARFRLRLIDAPNAKAVERHKYVLFLLLIGIFSITWPSIAPQITSDVSALGRSTSVLIGWRIFFDYPVFGSGFNSFQVFEGAYAQGLDYVGFETIVHNMFSGYAQQMGVLGLAYAFLPIALVLSISQISIGQRSYIALLFVLLGCFQGDYMYMSLTWFVLAIVASEAIEVERISPVDPAHPQRQASHTSALRTSE